MSVTSKKLIIFLLWSLAVMVFYTLEDKIISEESRALEVVK